MSGGARSRIWFDTGFSPLSVMQMITGGMVGGGYDESDGLIVEVHLFFDGVERGGGGAGEGVHFVAGRFFEDVKVRGEEGGGTVTEIGAEDAVADALFLVVVGIAVAAGFERHGSWQ